MNSFLRLAALTLLVVLPVLFPAAPALAGCGFYVDSNGNWAFGCGTDIDVGPNDYECSATICGLGQQFIYIINYILVPLLFAVAFITFLYGVANAYILSQGDPDEIKRGHKLILWGIIGFVVMLSLWGLVNIVSNTFGLDGARAPLLPLSY